MVLPPGPPSGGQSGSTPGGPPASWAPGGHAPASPGPGSFPPGSYPPGSFPPGSANHADPNHPDAPRPGRLSPQHPNQQAQHQRPPRPATRWVWCLAGVVVAIASVIALIQVFVVSRQGRLVDQAAFLGSATGREQVEGVTRLLTGVVSVPLLIVVSALAVGIACLRRRYGDAVRSIVIVAGANLTTQLLKEVLFRPVDDLPAAAYGNSLPSGHTTVAASIAAVAILVAPRVLRPGVAVLGAFYAAATGIATMSLSWHRPSDVVAAFAVVTAWTLLVLIPTRGREADGEPGTSGRILASWLLGMVALASLVVGAIALASAWISTTGDLTSASPLLTDSAERRAFLGSAAGVVGAAAASSWAMLLARR